MLTESTIVFIALSAIFAYSFYAVLVAGQLSLGQAGFAGLAAFVAVALAPDPDAVGDLPALLIALGIGIGVGAAAAVLLGLPTMHLRGVFLAIATLGFAEAIRIIIINMEWTGGAQGTSVPKILTPGVAWIVLAIVAYWFWRQAPSRYGRALAAIREDETAARAMGIDVGSHRFRAFVTSGAVAGIYGVLWAYFIRLLVPGDFSFTTAIDGLVSTVVGGMTAVFGPLLGGTLMTLVPEIQRELGVEGGWIRPFISGLVLLVVILFLPGGLARLFPRFPVRAPQVTGTDLGSAGVGLHARSHPRTGEVVADLEGVTKQYGGVTAVSDVTLQVRSGEVLGLIGPNGAGKTTLVNMLSGLVPATSGSLRVLGVRPGSTPVHKVAAAGVSRTFQHAKLFPRLTVLENVLVGAHLVARSTLLRRLVWLPSARRDEREAIQHAARCVERVGLTDKAQVNASALSYGDQRRLEIARALASDPSLLVLDEPAAGMNHVEAEELSALIGSLTKDGLTILLIEHNVGMVMRTCSRIVVLDFGRVLAEGDPEQVANDPRVIEAYLGAQSEETA